MNKLSAKSWLKHNPPLPHPKQVNGKLIWPLEPGVDDNGILYSSHIWESACHTYRILRAIHKFAPEDHCFALLKRVKRIEQLVNKAGVPTGEERVKICWEPLTPNTSKVDRFKTLEQAMKFAEYHLEKKRRNKNPESVSVVSNRQDAVEAAKPYELDSVPHPLVDITFKVKEPGEPKPAKEKKGPKGGGVFGHPTTGVLRWMGQREWSFAKAKKVLDHFHLNISDSTIKIQLRAGLKGERGEPTKLNPQEIKELMKIVKE